jgi:hypothetical protein
MSQLIDTEYDFVEPEPLPSAHIAYQLDGREVVTHGAPGISAEALATVVGAVNWTEVAEDYVPPLSQAEIAANRQAEILARLAEIDRESIRPLRAIADGNAVQADQDKIAALDSEATELRGELAGLG